ncbi:hypothetical protein BBJ28_00016432 [Nothophytophthora sp. Chile5]|nr:hypothetical protein BBJ28_00016432 [Nothophytophthora sp. Chile5]
MRSTDEFRDMERRLQSAIRERHEALEREAGMDAKLMEVQQLYEICEAQRSALSDGLDQAEEQTAALHAQWVEEKKNLLESVAKDDQKSVGLAAECERLRKANDSLKAPFRQSSEKEKKYFSILETQRRAAGESQAYITQLESELNDLRPQLDRLQAKEKKISSLENELSGTKEKLRRYLSKIDELEERLEQQEEATQAIEARFHERLSACPKSHVSYGQNGAKSVVKKHPFDFDLVFDSGCTQDDVFLEVSALIQSALDGYSVCIFAYGQTGLVLHQLLTGLDRFEGVDFGSERLSKSGSDNNKELLKEALAINKSLSSLGNVISALSKKSTHIPFRDSKLTHVLSPYLGGDSKTLMICNLSPLSQHRDETLNSLRFAKMVNVCDNTSASTNSSRS